MEKQLILNAKICLRCGYEWFSRLDKPKECPNCKSSFWFKESKTKKVVEAIKEAKLDEELKTNAVKTEEELKAEEKLR